MCKDLINEVKTYLYSSIGFWTAFFVIVWFCGWVLNAVHNTHFDLNSVQMMGLFVFGHVNINHACNSIFNSPSGVMPGTPNQPPQP